ncbi:hypothetical protein SEA_SUPPI_57 [Arthrobacter phage Suppi]|uniref:Uncharacterized protein n=2 Tax=Korravirus wayne TaxID=1982085 RepID=A0A1D8ESR3_9CAUD|nr:hypothetical protein SEA_SUPPI_57 [Arthrobacter phage Suppi]ASR83292.1 hypothetical protein SEA_CANOWICAKTE_57 [Arthrobacter phage Canowicakte]
MAPYGSDPRRPGGDSWSKDPPGFDSGPLLVPRGRIGSLMRTIEVHTLVRVTDSSKAKPEGFRVGAEYILPTDGLESGLVESATRKEIERMITESTAMVFLEAESRYSA